MTRDYAKRTKTSKRSKNNFWLWFALLLLFISLVIGLVVLKKPQAIDHPIIQTKPSLKNLEVKPASPITSTKTADLPKFDFYNILPPKKTTKAKTTATYELAIATVEDFAAADHLKAELTLLGFAVSITPIYQHNRQKHYVSIGPYDNQETALSDQQRLKLNKVKSEVKQVK